MCQELTETAKKRQYVYLLFLIIKLKKPNDKISLVTKDSDKIHLHFYITATNALVTQEQFPPVATLKTSFYLDSAE